MLWPRTGSVHPEKASSNHRLFRVYPKNRDIATLPDLGYKRVTGARTRQTERGKGRPAARERSARVPLLGRLIARRHARSVGARARRVVRRALAVPGRTLRRSAIAELGTP
jgi:hypothetical protein